VQRPAGRDRILVLGATSLIGGFLPAHLPTRPLGAGRGEQGPPGYDWARLDLAEPELQTPPAEVVVSLSPIWLLPPALPALAAGGMRRLVAFSSTSRLTKANSASAEERQVAARLAEGEEAVERICGERGVAWTVLRPTLIYSEGEDANVSRLAGLIRRYGVLPLSGFGGGLRQPVHAADLAQAALAVIEREQTFGHVYDLPGGETLTYRVMAERVFEGLGRTPRIITLPPPLWRLGLSLAGLKDATAAMGARMAEDLTFDPVPARRDFNWSPRAFRPMFVGR
jgi:nucleoside-diphosphate-sugar epimerase